MYFDEEEDENLARAEGQSNDALFVAKEGKYLDGGSLKKIFLFRSWKMMQADEDVDKEDMDNKYVTDHVITTKTFVKFFNFGFVVNERICWEDFCWFVLLVAIVHHSFKEPCKSGTAENQVEG